MFQNSYSRKGWYIEGLTAKFQPTNFPSRWILETTAPQNANNTGAVSATTGFDVGVTVSSSGPTVNASYSSSQTVRNDLTDWGVKNFNQPPKAEWYYNLRRTSKGEYSGPEAMFSDLNDGLPNLPDMSTGGFATRSEAVWKGPANSTDVFAFESFFKMDVRNAFVNIFGFPPGAWAYGYSAARTNNWTLYLNRVHL